MAIQSIGSMKLVLGLLGSASVAAVGGGYVIKDDAGRPMIQSLFSAPEEPVAQPLVGDPADSGEEVAALPETDQPPSQPEATIEEPELPTFDILRVEPDGSVVIAGQAPANSKVEIVLGERVLGETIAGAGWDFAVVFDNPLEPGDYELSIRATPDADDETSEPVLSAETAIITIPENEGEVLAMVQEAGEATRILQKPESMEPAAEAEPVQSAAIETSEEPAAPDPEPESKPVAVNAIDVEKGKIFIAGTGEVGRQVRIYINDVYKGLTTIGPQGGFLFELDEGLEAGSHNLRLDMLESGSGEVGSRVAVVVNHQPEPEPQIAAAEPEPVTPEPEAVAATQEAQPEVIQTGRSVIIRRGDNLWNISRRMLGQGRKYTMIFSANANQIKNPDRIFPGQVFEVPDEEPTQKADQQG